MKGIRRPGPSACLPISATRGPQRPWGSWTPGTSLRELYLTREWDATASFAPLPGEEREMDRRRGSGQGCALLPGGTGVPPAGCGRLESDPLSQGLGRWVKQEEGGAKFCSESPSGASKSTVA